MNVLVLHEMQLIFDVLCPLILHVVDSFLSDRWITYALKEFNAFFPFHIFQSPILFDE
jgi:hypothetical protein